MILVGTLQHLDLRRIGNEYVCLVVVLAGGFPIDCEIDAYAPRGAGNEDVLAFQEYFRWRRQPNGKFLRGVGSDGYRQVALVAVIAFGVEVRPVGCSFRPPDRQREGAGDAQAR